MKRTVLGPLLGFAIVGFVSSATAQAPSASGRPGRALGVRPGGSAAPHGSGHVHGMPPGMLGPHGSAAPSGSGQPPGGPDRPGLRQKMLERMATLKARRDAHLGQLRTRFSELHLKDEALKNELRRHARSIAFLTRARLVAEEELTEPKKAKVLKRIDVLLAKEQARHDRHVAKFTGARPAPSGSAPPFASGFVPPRAPSALARASGAPKPKPVPAASAGGAK